MSRPLVATISRAAMQHNLAQVRRLVPHAKVWAVIKANAYGHGLERAARAFSKADGFALTELESAIFLRESGFKQPMLLLEGFFYAHELPVISDHQLAVAIHCHEQVAMLCATRLPRPIDVHLKINSGMNRLGFKPEEYGAVWALLKELPSVRSITHMTHFANAEVPLHRQLPVVEQVKRVDRAIGDLPGERNLSNSAAILLHPALRSNHVRPGIMLYGATPGGKSAADFGLKPVMNLNSEIIQIATIERGEAIGYGSLFVAPHPMRIGIVACGYADGYPRSAPEGTPILVDGVRTRLIGRVSMDMISIDLTPVPSAHFGSTITLWGDGLPIDEVAEAAGTVGYELMCALSLRPRIEEL